MLPKWMNICRYSGLLARDGFWWLGMLLIGVVPFLSSLRMGTLSSFYLEIMTLFFAILLVTLTLLTQSQRVSLPGTSVMLLVLALLLVIQARLMSLPYASQSDLSALVLVVLAALVWAARCWVGRIGQSDAVTILAWALFIGAVLQSIVCMMQFAGVASAIPGLLTGPGHHYIYGQLAQRNHLGHYLMWGVLVLCFLWYRRQLPVWLAIPLLIWLTGILGLIGSRTIIAYVLVIGLSLLWWRCYAGAAANRFLLMIGLAIALVLLFQFILSPLCSWLFHIDFQSGSARLEQGSFANSGRQMEWHKAWLIFKHAPWFGTGWGSYAYEGFAVTGVYPHEFREYEGNVLFTYCHNLILQLLAETGLVGLFITVAGFLWAVWPHFRRAFNPASILMVSMMLVTLCHSMLEYPLWYSYFLAVFVLFVALTPLNEGDAAQSMQFRVPDQSWLKSGVAVGLLVMVAMLWQISLYQRFLSVRAEKNIPVAEQVRAMEHLRKQMYFLQYYVDMAIVEKLNRAETRLPVWGERAVVQAGRYRPYSNTFLRGAYLAQAGQFEQSEQWIDYMGHYYPTLLPNFLNYAQQLPKNDEMMEQIKQLCTQYQQQTARSLICNQ